MKQCDVVEVLKKLGLAAADMFFVRDYICGLISQLSFTEILPLIKLPAESGPIPFGNKGFVILRSPVKTDRGVMVCTRNGVWPKIEEVVYRMTFWIYTGEEFQRPFFSPCVLAQGEKFPTDLIFREEDVKDLKDVCVKFGIKYLYVGQVGWGNYEKDTGVTFLPFDDIREMLGTGQYVFPFIASARRQHVYRMDHNLPPVV